MDEADIAEGQTEIFLADALRRARRVAPAPQLIEHACLNCDADLVSAKQRFCDNECAADWQRRADVTRKQQGNA